MKIIIDKELVQGNYSVSFKSENLVDEEFEVAVSKHGKISVDFGGVFTETVTTETTNEITDPETGEVTTETVTESNEVEVLKFNNNLREINTEIDYTRVFKKSQYGENTEKLATIYADTMESRINEVLDELRSKDDNFSNDDVEIYY